MLVLLLILFTIKLYARNNIFNAELYRAEKTDFFEFLTFVCTQFPLFLKVFTYFASNGIKLSAFFLFFLGHHCDRRSSA